MSKLERSHLLSFPHVRTLRRKVEPRPCIREVNFSDIHYSSLLWSCSRALSAHSSSSRKLTGFNHAAAGPGFFNEASGFPPKRLIAHFPAAHSSANSPYIASAATQLPKKDNMASDARVTQAQMAAEKGRWRRFSERKRTKGKRTTRSISTQKQSHDDSTDFKSLGMMLVSQTQKRLPENSLSNA